jgi:hypothetical protein
LVFWQESMYFHVMCYLITHYFSKTFDATDRQLTGL